MWTLPVGHIKILAYGLNRNRAFFIQKKAFCEHCQLVYTFDMFMAIFIPVGQLDTLSVEDFVPAGRLYQLGTSPVWEFVPAGRLCQLDTLFQNNSRPAGK